MSKWNHSQKIAAIGRSKEWLGLKAVLLFLNNFNGGIQCIGFDRWTALTSAQRPAQLGAPKPGLEKEVPPSARLGLGQN